MVFEERSRVRDSVQATPVPRSDQRTGRLLRWLCRRRVPWMPVRETEEAEQDEQRDNEGRSRILPRKDIQVVVAIAMPCRPRQIASCPSSETWWDQDVHMNYLIGVHVTPWEDGVRSCFSLDGIEPVSPF